MKKEKDRIIYLITNIINSKIYVGQDSYNNPEYFGSGKLISRAIKKYGKKNFKKEILKHCKADDQLNAWEIVFIKKLDATNPKIGYNLTRGGGGFKSEHKEKAKQAIAKACKERVWRQESKDKIRDALKNKPKSEEHRKKMSKFKVGHKPSSETRNKQSKSRKKFYKEHPEVKLKSEEACENMKLAQQKFVKEHPNAYKDNSGCFKPGQTANNKGKIWIHKGEGRKFIKPEELESYSEQGWSKGLGENSLETRELKRKSSTGKIGVNNGKISRFVKAEELQFYLEHRWFKGLLKSKNRIKFSEAISRKKKDMCGKKCINNGEISKYIKPEELNIYLEQGWTRGMLAR
jgi:hypothetical protein